MHLARASGIALPIGALSFGVLMGFAWHGFSGSAQAASHPEHICQHVACSDVVGVGLCPGTALCESSNMDQFWKCMPNPPTNCNENTQQHGATICAGICSTLEMEACNYTLGHCQ